MSSDKMRFRYEDMVQEIRINNMDELIKCKNIFSGKEESSIDFGRVSVSRILWCCSSNET